MSDMITVNGKPVDASNMDALLSAWLELAVAKVSPHRLTVEGVIFPNPDAALRSGMVTFRPRAGMTYVTVDPV